MTPLEIKIYNTHLVVSRTLKNKPFKVKKSFDGFEEDPKYVSIKRLVNFFTRYPDIDMTTYFKAPYKLYNDVYKQLLTQTLPDTQFDSVKESLVFISRFCLKNKIQLHDYLSFKENGSENSWVYHIKKNEINPYSLMEFDNVSSYINEMAEDTKEFFLGDFGKNFLEYRQKYINSEKLRPFLIKAFIKLKLFIDKSLNS